jgi:hypothetical protein
MGQLQKSAATIGFYGDDLDPDEITALLRMTPSVGVAKGGKWVTSRGAEKVAHTGSWRFKTDRCEPEDLNRQIEGLFAPLTSDLAVWRDLARRFRGVVFCGLWLKTYNDGLQLSPEVLGSIAERGLLLDLDIYANDDPD